MRSRNAIGVSVVFCAGLLLNSCVPAKVTGGGSLLSSDASGPAAFTVTGNNCGETVKGKLTLVDRFTAGYSANGGLRLSADVTRAILIGSLPTAGTNGSSFTNDTQCAIGEYEVDFNYISTNARIRGGGAGYACLATSGKGKDKQNHARIALTDGVFNGYTNDADVSGNFNLAACSD